MKANDIVAVAHNGELVCWDCMTRDETIVAQGAPGAKIMEEDGYLSPAYANELTDEDICGRCLQPILEHYAGQR